MKEKVSLIWFILLFQIIKCFACSCINKPSINERSIIEALDRKEAILTGIVVDKREINVPYKEEGLTFEGMSLNFSQVTLQIDSLYKGNIQTKTINVITGIGMGDCGFNFQLGQSYIIYGNLQTSFYKGGEIIPLSVYTDICDRTQLKDKQELSLLSFYLEYFEKLTNLIKVF